MKFKILTLLLFLTLSSMADNDFNIHYKVPLIPLEITVDKNGVDFSLTKEIMTPLGSFGLGYSAYKAEFEEDYTYVIIEDMNLRKEHIYKVKDKSTLRLVSKGTTGVEITKNRVHIMIEKGSEFKLEFEVVENDNSSYGSSRSKWIDVSSSTCRNNGGEINSDGMCYGNWNDSNKICKVSGGRLPSIDELRAVVKSCGGIVVVSDNKIWSKLIDRNKANKSYQKCYKSKGFSFDYSWSSTSYNKISSNYFWVMYFNYGTDDFSAKGNNRYVRCVRVG